MFTVFSWQEVLFVCLSVTIIAAYHGYLYTKVHRHPLKTAIGITNHARQMWVREVREDKRDILAIQTMRNQVMSATFLASTAILISLGLLGAAFHPGTFNEVSHALYQFGTKTEGLWMFKLMLLGILFFYTFLNFTLALRYYNHFGFMINTYEQNDSTVSAKTVTQVLNHGALHYTIGMRGYYLSVPLALWLFDPIWMLAGSIAMVITLYHLDSEA